MQSGTANLSIHTIFIDEGEPRPHISLWTDGDESRNADLGIARWNMPFDDIAWGNSIYSCAVTLDPNEVDAAWETLNSNEWAIDFADMPRHLHDALIVTLKERGFAALAKR